MASKPKTKKTSTSSPKSKSAPKTTAAPKTRAASKTKTAPKTQAAPQTQAASNPQSPQAPVVTDLPPRIIERLVEVIRTSTPREQGIQEYAVWSVRSASRWVLDNEGVSISFRDIRKCLQASAEAIGNWNNPPQEVRNACADMFLMGEKTMEEIAREYGVTGRKVKRWVLARAGKNAPFKPKVSRRKSEPFAPEMVEGFHRVIREKWPSDFGFYSPQRRWTIHSVLEWMNAQGGREWMLHDAQRLVKRHGPIPSRKEPRQVVSIKSRGIPRPKKIASEGQTEREPETLIDYEAAIAEARAAMGKLPAPELPKFGPGIRTGKHAKGNIQQKKKLEKAKKKQKQKARKKKK